MKIHLAADHAGFAHKQALYEHLMSQGITPFDHGAFTLVPEDDFPDVMTPLAKAVAEDPEAVAIIFGGSGQGEAMCVNRIAGIRAAVYYGGTHDIVSLSRMHNNANILSIGARFITTEEMIAAVELWLSTSPLSDEKYTRRNAKF